MQTSPLQRCSIAWLLLPMKHKMLNIFSTAISSCVPGYYSLLLQNYTYMTAYKPYTVFGNICLLVYHNTCTLYIVTFNVYKSWCHLYNYAGT